MHHGCAKWLSKEREKEKMLSPYLKLNQSIKPIMDIEWSSMYTLIPKKKKNKRHNMRFNCWIQMFDVVEGPSMSKESQGSNLPNFPLILPHK